MILGCTDEDIDEHNVPIHVNCVKPPEPDHPDYQKKLGWNKTEVNNPKRLIIGNHLAFRITKRIDLATQVNSVGAVAGEPYQVLIGPKHEPNIK